jgi:hypothetical protein
MTHSRNHHGRDRPGMFDGARRLALGQLRGS